MSDFDVLSLLNVRNVKLDLMVNKKTKQKKPAKFSAKYVQKKNALKPLYGPPKKKQKIQQQKKTKKNPCNSIQ